MPNCTLHGPALVVGCGYLGLRVAQRWLAAGRQVYAVTRRPERAAELAGLGLRPIVADVTRRESLQALPAVQTVLYAVGRDPQNCLSDFWVYAFGLYDVLDRLAALDPRPDCAIFISSTAVYGDTAGRWVSESSPCLATRRIGKVLLAAEVGLQAHALAGGAIVLRMAGLYGPGRLPRLTDLLEGKPLPTDPQALLNLIHVEDAADAVLAAEARGRRPGVYNIADGHPVLRGDFYCYLAELLGCQPPTFDPQKGVGRRDREGNKRVDNQAMLRELQVRLNYPSYREGLAQIVADDRRLGQGP